MSKQGIIEYPEDILGETSNIVFASTKPSYWVERRQKNLNFYK